MHPALARLGRWVAGGWVDARRGAVGCCLSTSCDLKVQLSVLWPVNGRVHLGRVSVLVVAAADGLFACIGSHASCPFPTKHQALLCAT